MIASSALRVEWLAQFRLLILEGGGDGRRPRDSHEGGRKSGDGGRLREDSPTEEIKFSNDALALVLT